MGGAPVLPSVQCRVESALVVDVVSQRWSWTCRVSVGRGRVESALVVDMVSQR